MLLTIDIGNTNILFGSFDGEKLLHKCRLKTDTAKTFDEYFITLHSIWQLDLGADYSYHRCIISSVVPQLTRTFSRLAEERLGAKTLLVGAGIKTGLKIRTANPSAVGADRVVNAVAARDKYGLGALIVDFGTATSFDVVDDQGQYLGGAIAPGIEIAIDALATRTAKLPRIDIQWPASVVGDDTVSAMHSGCVMGYVCMLEGMISRILNEVPSINHVIATGGFSTLVKQHSESIDIFDLDLPLYGMQVLDRLNS